MGEDPNREGLLETPARVARMYEEIFSGLEADPEEHLKIFDEGGRHDELVLVKDIPSTPCASTTCCPLSAGPTSPTSPKRQDYRPVQVRPHCGLLRPPAPGPGAPHGQIADFLYEKLEPLGWRCSSRRSTCA